MDTDRPAADECPPSERVDGKKHSVRFMGDDPYTECVYCGEVRDAISGRVIREGAWSARRGHRDETGGRGRG